MSSNAMGWEPLLSSGVSETAALRGALFTTYDHPDGQLLAEQVLRSLLRVDRQASAEHAAHGCFLLELFDRVHALKDDIVIVSSTSRDEVSEVAPFGSPQYRWMFDLIRPLTVGKTGTAVQHAKLWLLHWEDAKADAEYLEVVVSSANLTYASFSSQLQAAWRLVVQLQKRASETQRKTWGILPHFLSALGESTGDPKRVARMSDLLARATCPANVTFLASVPGRHSAQTLRKTPWGAAGLSKVVPPGHAKPKIFVSAPSIGDWSEQSIVDWAQFAESSPERVSLVWVDQEHDWARPGRWCMTVEARSAMLKAGVTLTQYGSASDHNEGEGMHEEHATRDRRWSHAKLYGLVRGRSRILLVTSANFSTSAWGRLRADKSLHITNFELGVAIPKLQWPFPALDPFENVDRAAVADRPQPPQSTPIEWAYAEWDGAEVRCQVRCVEPEHLEALLITHSSEKPIGLRESATDALLLCGTIAWCSTQEAPLEINLRCGAQELRVPVFDVRAHTTAIAAAVTGLSEDEASAVLDDLLFERFGFVAVSEAALEGGSALMLDTNLEGAIETDDTAALVSGDSYGIAEFEWARRHLAIVDSWQMQVDREATRKSSRYAIIALRRDGQQLVAAFERVTAATRAGEKEKVAGAQLALEEMRVRLAQLEMQNAAR